SYPVRLDTDLSLGAISFRACSGAVTDDIYNPNPANLPEVAQLTSLRDSTRTITLTIGGNDLGFEDVLAHHCVNGQRAGSYGCSNDRSLRQQVQSRLDALAGKTAGTIDGRTIHSLLQTYRDIHAGAPNAHIWVGGYPRLFGIEASDYTYGRKAAGACIVGVTTYHGIPLTYSVDYLDALWMDGVGTKLNTIIASAISAAKREGIQVSFVPASLFAGHGLCDRRTAWLNPIVFGTNSITGLPEPESESFHPSDVGQRYGYEGAFRLLMRRKH